MKRSSADQKFEEGLILFARYAFAPNYFRYCGPDKNKDVAEALRGNFDQRELRQILNHFEAAVPYLSLIAKSNQIDDPFDPRVVEAYWLGNGLLFNVPARAVYRHLSEQVKERSKSKWRSLEDEIGFGIKPNHSFHVLDIYRIAGFTMNGTRSSPVLDLINNCRISWGRINLKLKTNNLELSNQELLIKSQKIETKDRKFILVRDEKRVQNTGLNIKQGDLVSTHWGFVCDKISKIQAKNLEFWTRYHLRITNRFI